MEKGEREREIKIRQRGGGSNQPTNKKTLRFYVPSAFSLLSAAAAGGGGAGTVHSGNVTTLSTSASGLQF